jgi:hypothetical protein
VLAHATLIEETAGRAEVKQAEVFLLAGLIANEDEIVLDSAPGLPLTRNPLFEVHGVGAALAK